MVKPSKKSSRNSVKKDNNQNQSPTDSNGQAISRQEPTSHIDSSNQHDPSPPNSAQPQEISSDPHHSPQAILSVELPSAVMTDDVMKQARVLDKPNKAQRKQMDALNKKKQALNEKDQALDKELKALNKEIQALLALHPRLVKWKDALDKQAQELYEEKQVLNKEDEVVVGEEQALKKEQEALGERQKTLDETKEKLLGQMQALNKEGEVLCDRQKELNEQENMPQKNSLLLDYFENTLMIFKKNMS